MGAVGGFVPLPFVQPVSHAITNALDRSEAVIENRETCKGLQGRTRKLIRLVTNASIVEHDETPSPRVKQTLVNSEKSLLAIAEELDEWIRLEDSSKEFLRSLEYRQYLDKCQVDLEDIRFNLALETTLAIRTELMKMGTCMRRLELAHSSNEVADTSSHSVTSPDEKESETVSETEQQTDEEQLQRMSDVHGVNQMAEQNTKHKSRRSCLDSIIWLWKACTECVIWVLRTSFWSSGHGRYKDGSPSCETLTNHQTCRIASPLAGLPAAPEHFYGRDKIVNDMIVKLRKDARQSKHMALYGAIKTGKSTIARMLVNRIEVARMFGGSRHWIRCQSAANVDALLYALAASLSLKTKTGDPLTEILEHLEVNPSSLLIILDDFEMPESEDEIEKLKDALGKLSQCRLAKTYILLTTRDLPLPEGVAWLHFLVEPLSADAAISMFRAISGHAEDPDDEVRGLVMTLGCLPFSISIVARQRQVGFRPSELLMQLESGQDKRLGRIDNVVRISLTSQRFTSSPGALTLLCILARLPRGVQFDKLPLVAPLIPNVFDELRRVMESGHASREADGFIVLQAPTRSYISKHQVLDGSHIRALRQYYCQICKDADHELGTEKFKNASQTLVLEEGNARAVLLDALDTQPSTDVLRAVIGYANFINQDTPNTEVTAKALDAIEKVPCLDVDGDILPRCLYSHARLLQRLDRYHEARQALGKAENVLGTTCEYGLLGQINALQGQVNRVLGNDALAVEFYTKGHERSKMVHYVVGISESLQGLALMSLKEGDIEKAIQLLDRAKQECCEHEPSITALSFYTGWVLRHKDSSYSASLLLVARESYAKYGARYRVALCTYQLGIALYSSGNHDKAEQSLLLAYREFDELENYGQMGYALDHLVELELQRGNFEQALQYNGEARAIFEKIKNPTEVVDCYVSRGRVFAKMRRIDDARESYNKARTVAIKECNSNQKLIQMIDGEVRNLNQRAGWRRFLPW
ncbi:hypothetical protein APHAL10511_005337 [Amanita phalloides]|nr:hypothetical protein APHAL10511_005337 [Amanita phalloides]